MYEHHERRGKVTHEKVILVASAIPHLLAPGNYSYPFAYTLRPDLPGCAQFTREREASDPAWRSAGRRIRTHGEVTYKIKAYVDFNGLFSRDLFSKQALTVNSAFDWQHSALTRTTLRPPLRPPAASATATLTTPKPQPDRATTTLNQQ